VEVFGPCDCFFGTNLSNPITTSYACVCTAFSYHVVKSRSGDGLVGLSVLALTFGTIGTADA